ncbi:inositol monophosphatase family protein [Actinophytocola gossypii]|uniref:Inositol-1-monophosphatase n=1 Tax=Actinophytocola gossypii TaxID=2812003 RepID=A0ABT2J801_9PSEU|nr:inositol monophosphatase family protein [Actinophytocola gossypii]MCT2583985.1 inositol monophosphatase [Actinophytocola gossypii]
MGPVGVEEGDLLEIAVSVASAAAELARTAREDAIRDVGTKSSETDVVTAADLAVERLVRERLAELRPGEPVLGEEAGGSTPTPHDGVSWVVDPIDGTVNYLYGYPWYAVSLAAQVGGESVAAAVVEPVSGRRWTAARGGGAFLDGRPLRVSASTRLELSLVGTGFAYRPERRVRQAAGVPGLLSRVRDIRRAGAASLDLCAVAAGWLDGYFEHGLNRWDWAGGALIAAEAGAVVRLPESDDDTDGLTFVAAPGIADDLWAALAETGYLDL